MHSTAAGRKICCVCGKDVTHDRRMKDAATGRYWCYSCGAAEQSAQHSGIGVGIPCPECNKMCSPQHMHKVKDHYVCEHCYNAHHSSVGKKNGKTAGKKSGNQTLIAVGVAAVVVGAVLFVLKANDML